MAQPKDATGSGEPSGDEGAMRIDPDLVRELAELLTANELTEIEVEDGERRIKVSRDPAPVISAAAPAPLAPVAASAAPAAEEAAAQEVAGNTIKSPMVGTAFLSPQPDAKPFVEAGDAVKAGDTLLIVEAMKVMNPITAPESGVVKILVSATIPNSSHWAV